MDFDPPLESATLIRRYKRFLVDLMLPSGTELTLHCPNTGSMKACLLEGGPAWYSTSNNPKRKYPNTWEVATTPSGALAGINTGRANHLVLEAIEQGVIVELQGYASCRTEVRYGEERSRIDILLEDRSDDARPCYVEVKSLTMECGDGWGAFPDAVSARGTKHLRELQSVVEQGGRAVLCFCVQHTGIDRTTVAADIDPLYVKALRDALAAGVEVIAYGAEISPERIAVVRSLPFVLSPIDEA